MTQIKIKDTRRGMNLVATALSALISPLKDYSNPVKYAYCICILYILRISQHLPIMLAEFENACPLALCVPKVIIQRFGLIARPVII